MAHVIIGATCPQCGSTDTAHPTNYGKPQRDRLWCLSCGALWTPEAPPRAKPEPRTCVFCRRSGGTYAYRQDRATLDAAGVPHTAGAFFAHTKCLQAWRRRPRQDA